MTVVSTNVGRFLYRPIWHAVYWVSSQQLLTYPPHQRTAAMLPLDTFKCRIITFSPISQGYTYTVA